MFITISQAIILYLLLDIIKFVVKKLIITYSIKILETHKSCNKCLSTKKTITIPSWKIKPAHKNELPVFLCDDCKKESFPGELSDFAEKHNYIEKIESKG